MHNRLLKQKYKTFHGAAQRAAFERGIAPSEFARGITAKRYQFRVVFVDGAYRVERSVAENKPVQS